MRVPLAALRLALLLLLPALPVTPARAADPVEIAVVVDGPWARNNAIFALFQTELVDLLGDEFGVTLAAEDMRTADWTLAGIRRELDQAFADPNVDIVIGLGVISSGELARRASLPKPAVAPFVIDAEVQGAPLANGRSGVPNLSYITTVNHARRDLKAFLEIVSFRKMTVLATSTVMESIPEMPERLREVGREQGVETTVVPVTASAAEALAAIPRDTEAVYVAPLLQLPDAEFDRLVAELIARKLPSFSLLGRGEVERGILAGLTPKEEFARIARRTALNIQRILLGEAAGSLPVHFANAEQLALNIATARAIGIRPSWAILTVADQVDEKRTEEELLTLVNAVQEAVATNLDLIAEEQTVDSGEEDVKIARSAFLPQLDVSASGIVIDKERAEASFGAAAERTVTGSASLSQVIFSDDALTNLDVQHQLQTARERDRDQIRLDIAQQTATAYLDVLRAKTLERIQRETLERTEANLELARTRETIGYSGPAEVYRWEGELATQRLAVIDANSLRNVAEIALNHLLHRPAEQPFRTEETGFDNSRLGVADPRMRRHLADPWSFRILREFLSDVAQENSPEVQALDASIAAQERVLANSGRAFVLPTVGLSGEVNHTLDRAGAGSEPSAATPEDTQWNVGIQATLPLFSGGSRYAERRQAQKALDELETRRQALTERIEQRLRTAMHLAGASYAGIELSQQAADAARRNYDLVTDAYSNGVVAIIDLIDAQNSSRVAEQNAANAVYDFLIDYVEVERAAGFLTCLGEHGSESFFKRLDAFREERENQ